MVPIFIEQLWRSLTDEAVSWHELTNGFQAKPSHSARWLDASGGMEP